MTKIKSFVAGGAVDSLIVYVGRDLIQFAFTYPLSTLDSGVRAVLLMFGFGAVAFFAFLSCFPNKSQNDRFRILEGTTFLYLVVTVCATYYSYRDDVAPRGPNQLGNVLASFQNQTNVALGNNTGMQDLAKKTLDNALASTEYLHVFILNFLSMLAICLLYCITKFVHKHTLDYLGLITCLVSIWQVFTSWYKSTKLCVDAAAREHLNSSTGQASQMSADEIKNANKGGLNIISEVFKCAGNFDTLQGTTLALTSVGCVAIFATFVVVVLRLGIIKRIMNLVCCCCFGSKCASALDTATCSALGSPIGDGFVLVGIVVSMLCVGATHFLSSAWAVELQHSLEKGGNKLRDSIVRQNGTSYVFDAVADVFKEKWEADSLHEMIAGFLVVITALTLLVHVMLFIFCASGKKTKNSLVHDRNKRDRRASTGESVAFTPAATTVNATRGSLNVVRHDLPVVEQGNFLTVI